MLKEGIAFDGLHYNISKLDSYNKKWNFCWSPRELGKTTAIDVQKIYKLYKENGWPSVILFNMAADMTEAQVLSMENTINKFKGREVHLRVKKDCGTIWVIYDDSGSESRIFCIYASVGAPIRRLKGLNLGPIGCIVYDEFMVNTKVGEKYPTELAFRIKEIYKTFVRECRPRLLRIYCMGNPYSRYHPLFVALKVNINDIQKGKTLVGDNYVIDAAVLSEELKKSILENDPSHEFDDPYERYAFEGDAINDDEINIAEKQPENYRLKTVFKVNDRYLWVYKGDVELLELIHYARYWMRTSSEKPGKRQDIICVDFSSLVQNGALASLYKGYFDNLKANIAANQVLYESPEAYYLAQLVYQVI
jgi:hypothetical protein